MKRIAPVQFLILAVLLALACGIVGFFIGEKTGVKKGAHIGAGFALLNLDAHKDFMLLLEGCLQNGGSDEEKFRKIMIDGLDTYLPARMLLAAPPFDQKYERFSQDEAAINAAIERLREHVAVITYKTANQMPEPTAASSRGSP